MFYVNYMSIKLEIKYNEILCQLKKETPALKDIGLIQQLLIFFLPHNTLKISFTIVILCPESTHFAAVDLIA